MRESPQGSGLESVAETPTGVGSRSTPSPAKKHSYSGRGCARALVSLLVVASIGCRFDSERRMAERILDRYRRSAAAKPLPLSHVG
ncbi:MAG: hypothetical protein DMF55_05695 [Acidobacteria bacterium]|nr:MAG: hypothetical protein DMF55_05695 [Acidobacteriota bacterium]